VALQRRGHEVTVIEERTETSSGAGISIWPNALAALDEIGVGDAVRAAGGRVTAGALRWRNGAWLRHPAPERLVKALGEPLVVIRRSALTKVLADALADGTVHTGLSALELVTTTDGVRLALSDSTMREAAAVIGADGTRSIVARHLNGALADRYVGYTAWRGVADCAIDPDVAGGAGPGHRVRPRSVAVECVLVARSCGVPLRGLGFGLATSGPAWAGSYRSSAGAG
jgi:2-polyprenyl-6-methoxyphenol hydroxylase-like FAD-dependent oxidoreductase